MSNRTQAVQSKYLTWENVLFVNHASKITRRISLDYGVRMSVYKLPGKRDMDINFPLDSVDYLQTGKKEYL